MILKHKAKPCPVFFFSSFLFVLTGACGLCIMCCVCLVVCVQMWVCGGCVCECGGVGWGGVWGGGVNHAVVFQSAFALLARCERRSDRQDERLLSWSWYGRPVSPPPSVAHRRSAAFPSRGAAQRSSPSDNRWPPWKKKKHTPHRSSLMIANNVDMLLHYYYVITNALLSLTSCLFTFQLLFLSPSYLLFR